MSDKISGKFHPIPSTIANQRWISIRNIFVFGGHFVPWLPWQRPPFWICSTPKAATYYSGYSYKVDHNMAPKPWISIPNIKIYLETKFRPNRRIFVFWRPLSHSKPTMDIDSQHHNLVGIFFFAQIGGFLYFGGNFGFKMATIANQLWMSIRNIINYLETKFRPNRKIFVLGGHFIPWLPWQWPPFWFFSTPPQKLSHTMVDIPTKWIII